MSTLPVIDVSDLSAPAAPINWGAFRARRAAGDYADHGRYAQIRDYHRSE